MKSSKPSFAVVSALFAVLVSVSPGSLYARDAEPGSLIFAAADTARQQCIQVCRARRHSCLSLKLIPSSECRGVYQDCVNYTCNAPKG